MPLHAIDAYARAVNSGALPAGKYHRLGAARHHRDRAREGTREFPFLLDTRRADRFFRFAALLRHYKGEWAGRVIELQPHQHFRLGSIVGWVHRDTGLRRFRTAYNEIPRKNGKSLEAALVALWLAFFDGEPGAEGYCIATKREQAKIVFSDCKKLVQSSELRTRISVLMANLHRDDTASKLQPLGADADSTDGLNPSVVIVDELHKFKTRDLLDVMETATGARRQPLHFQITTAGDDPVSPCGDQHDYACKILDGVLTDETFFAFLVHADLDDDWTDERTWAKANPNFGISVRPEDLRAAAFKAQHMPAAAASFKQKRLNLWVNTLAPWLSPEGWRRGQTLWLPEELRGEPCWIGVDLSSKIDLTAVVALFRPTLTRASWRMLVWCLTPEETLLERARRDRAPFPQWVEAGYLHTNPRTRIDQDRVLEQIAALGAMYPIEGIGVDPWNAGNLIADLHAAGYQPIEIEQTYKGMSAAAKEFEADVLDGLVDAGGHPLMAWCVANAVVQRDNKDNIYPVKKKSRGRIDPVIAAVMARKLAAIPAEAPADDPVLVVV